MDLLRNPFHILSASIRDDRRQIMDLADERSLILDSGECMEARAALTNPRKRLSAEVAWLPGIGPKRAKELLSLVESSPTNLLAINELSAIARANLLAAGLARLSDHTSEDAAEWIRQIALAFESVDHKQLCAILNEERIVSGFPSISDISAIEAELHERRRYYRQVIQSSIDKLPPRDLVKAVTLAVESATDLGEEQGPVLIADLVDSYEVEAQVFLEKEQENIKFLVEKLWAAVDADESDSVLAPLVNQLIDVVRNWDTVAQPIQVSAKSRGLDHDASQEVAGLVRGLVVHMTNEHGKLDFAQQITNMSQEVFAEVRSVAERTEEDIVALENLSVQREQLSTERADGNEKWKSEITYEADVGAFFKEHLKISPNGIEWRGRRWDLDSITRVRWGGTRHSINGIPTGTTYSIVFGNRLDTTSIDLRRNEIYSNFVDRLWRTVGVRLLFEYLEGLRAGQTYRFGSVVVKDHGMELERKKFFARNDRVFCSWTDLQIWNGAGVFCIGHKEDKNLSASFSYQSEDNIHVLEAAIRMFWKQGGTRLSSLLDN